MILVWTLVIHGYIAGKSDFTHEAVFLTKEECIRVSDVIVSKLPYKPDLNLCYESSRIDLGGK